MSNSVSVAKFLNVAIKKNICSYAFSNPQTTDINIGVELTDQPTTFSQLSELSNQEGFVFVPFDTSSENKSYVIIPDITNVSLDNYEEICNYPNNAKFPEQKIVESSQVHYREQINQMLAVLKSKHLDKVILSRIKFIPSKSNISPVDIFLQINQTYPDAFVFMVNIPNVGLWLGASPEQLANYDGEELKTVALAGTQRLENRNISTIKWQEKEIEEQALVAKYIDNLFVECGIVDLEKSKPFTVQAGGVVHLKTTYRARITEWKKAVDFVSHLHPTPAVCGLPKVEAKQLIKKIEPHDRAYYAGYLGMITNTGAFSFFVNLRSMQILSDGMALYVGGGITAQSEEEKEWLETCHKAETLLKIINSKS